MQFSANTQTSPLLTLSWISSNPTFHKSPPLKLFIYGTLCASPWPEIWASGMSLFSLTFLLLLALLSSPFAIREVPIILLFLFLIVPRLLSWGSSISGGSYLTKHRCLHLSWSPRASIYSHWTEITILGPNSPHPNV